MDKSIGRICCLSISALAIGSAFAQSSVNVYGTLDLGIDQVNKRQGNAQGTVFGLAGTTPIPNTIASPASKTIRVSPSLTSQSHLGLKGQEKIGNGYSAGFTLEAGMAADNGQLTNDGRLFGRQAFASLTTPYGEVRLGRQPTPMLIGYYIATTEKLGSTNLLGTGLVIDNTQIFQDNIVEYVAKRGPWIASLSYSPNEGIASRVSTARSTAIRTTLAANQETGQIIGGASAGAKTPDRRGHSEGALLAYTGTGLSAVLTFHRTNLGGATIGLASPAGDGSLIAWN